MQLPLSLTEFAWLAVGLSLAAMLCCLGVLWLSFTGWLGPLRLPPLRETLTTSTTPAPGQPYDHRIHGL